MNIFVLDPVPSVAAIYHCDRHVVCMVKEYAQVLSNVHHLCTEGRREGIYKPFNPNHPVVKWVMESSDNYEWLYELYTYLSEEYHLRYGKEHTSYIGLKDNLRDVPLDMEDLGVTMFVQCMPEEYRDRDPVIGYRNFYIRSKIRFATWRYPRDIPEWMLEAWSLYHETKP